MKSKRMILATGMIALAAGIGAMVGATSSGAASTAVYLRTSAVAKNLSADGSAVTILSVSVPAGTWVVTAKANPVNFGAADYVRCQILVGSAQKDAGATLLGDASPGITGELGPSVATIALQTAVVTTATRNISLKCLHDFPIDGEYVDPSASLMVVAAPGPIG